MSPSSHHVALALIIASLLAAGCGGVRVVPTRQGSVWVEHNTYFFGLPLGGTAYRCSGSDGNYPVCLAAELKDKEKRKEGQPRYNPNTGKWETD